MSEIVNIYSFPISGQFQGWPVAESGFELRHPDPTVPHISSLCVRPSSFPPLAATGLDFYSWDL